ncbi:hypothetical protein NW762_013109 [Fusarium torreyae]|uniref:Extracellular membrane protein CFEM domain-containing protein n=1 Tax=Fusarium torreyae TaxID=1237075 RepID=A0A9W8V7Q0_9HYPO|nr:hypothetical protein NW762_013109 [Fusarium torreyae]
MFQPLFAVLVTSFLGVTPGLAEKLGYFESKECVDPSGFETCYKDAGERCNDCVNDNCKGKNIDCANVCTCVMVEEAIDCALTSCWNKGERTRHLSLFTIRTGSFFPAPDDAPGACSCNLGKIASTIARAEKEMNECEDRNKKFVESLTSTDEIEIFGRACLCGTYSVALSSVWDICPDTDPGFLGADDLYAGLVATMKSYEQCADYIDTFDCISDLKFTPPGKDKSAKVYAPGEFPKNGTKTVTTNRGGSITSPLSGATLSWTAGNIERTITAVNADAKPTGSSSGKDNKAEESSGSGKVSEDDENDNEEDAAFAVVLQMWPLLGLILAIIA